MAFKRSAFFVFIFTALSFKGLAQEKTSTFYNPIFKWKITVPANFIEIKQADYERLQKKGTEAIEKTYDGQKVGNRAKPLLVFKNDALHYFEANYQPFDEQVDGSHDKSNLAVGNVIYTTFKTQMQGVKLDSSYTSDVIDKLKFAVFKLNITIPDKAVLKLRMYSRVFNKKEFSVSIMYVDENKGKAMLDALKQSTFAK